MKKKNNRYILVFLISLFILSLTGCWNYTEIENSSIVAGVSIDKVDNMYLVTVEIVDMQFGQDINMRSQIIEGWGTSIFEAIRNMIQISGKKLYWSHAKILILSQEIAKEDLLDVLDFFARDSEPRFNLHVLVSKEKRAQVIFKGQKISEEVKSIDIEDMLSNQKSNLKVTEVFLYELINEIEADGKSPVLPTIGLVENNNEIRAELSGTAIFKKDKFIGILDSKETKLLHYILHKTKGGLLSDNLISKGENQGLTLEVFQNGTKTKFETEYQEGSLKMKVNIYITAAVAENRYQKNLMLKEEIDQIKEDSEEAMADNIEMFIKKVQSQYESDIFGFGAEVREDMPEVWKQVKGEWDSIFKNLETEVKVDFKLVNKARISKPIKVGD